MKRRIYASILGYRTMDFETSVKSKNPDLHRGLYFRITRGSLVSFHDMTTGNIFARGEKKNVEGKAEKD